MRHILVVALFVAACGGKSSAPAHGGTAEGPGPGSGGSGPMGAHEGEHDDMSPELKKFHDAFAPRWHAEKGAKRTADTCAAVPEFQADADAIGKATPPAIANADTWTSGTRALVATVGKLADACKANDASKFEAAFGEVHEAFHGLMGMAGMHHDEGQEGMEHHEGMEGMHHDMHESHEGHGGGDGKGGGDHEHKM